MGNLLWVKSPFLAILGKHGILLFLPHQNSYVMSQKKTSFSKDTKFAELMTEDRRLLQLLPRFGIGLGFGDRSVDQVCQMNHVNTELFLIICEIYSDSTFRLGKSELRQLADRKSVV